MATATLKDKNVPEPNPKKPLESTDLISPQAEAAANNEPVNDAQKKMKRAERFGMPVQLSEKEKRSSRAERFGSAANPNETDAVKGSEDQKWKARAERFGLSTETMLDEEAKKKARLARFSQPSVAAVSHANDEGKHVQSATVASNAGGAA